MQYDSLGYDFAVKIFATDSMHLWILGCWFYFNGPAETYIYRSGDGGLNWNLEYFGYGYPRDFVFADSLNGWVAGLCSPDESNSYYVMHTHDGGVTWQGQFDITSMPESEWKQIRSICFTDSLHGWIAGGLYDYTNDTSGVIYCTTNGGATWTKQLGDTIPSLNGIKFTDSLTGWAVGKAGTILHTIDGGVNWFYQVSGVLANLNSIYFIDDANGWICGDSSTVLHTTNGGYAGIEPTQQLYNEMKIFPNPVHRSATIDIILKQNQNIILKVYNILGELKLQMPLGIRQKGQNSISLDVSDLPAGVYLLELIRDQTATIRKIIIE